MKKILILTYSSLLFTISMQGMKPSTVNPLVKQVNENYKFLKQRTQYYKNLKIEKDQPSPRPKLDPHIFGTALAMALYNNDKKAVLDLFDHEETTPNYIVTPELLDALQNNNPHTNQSEDERPFSKLRDHETSKQTEGLPVFYLAKEFDLIKTCIDNGANVSLSYRLPTRTSIHYGNIIAYLIDHLSYFDNPDYPCAKLIALYLKNNAGPYAPSYKSRGGSSLHHLVQVLSTANDQDIKSLYECASRLIECERNLLHDRDHHGKTPSDCLKLI